MTKAYSNRALPAGTVLREWRLEEVLGVGGFGIVYKARGIYFNELVAIKEYFPSSISERDDDDTVVPIDSHAEEVHALGLKKFVEEAKLLWNLSTPTRHPNIVSVRSLFEIHGTAYMVMDFEDGTPLSKALKKGRKFNESSLRAMILPIAQGLELAHRVGVLHRDIKPPNIILNDDGHSVLIDFGSARFESGEATSTKVTFHTPPYAAVEQYVRTFPQGPWTDIYALGVVLYICIIGEKPAEALERIHGNAGVPLAHRNLPGFSLGFLKAIDTAMLIKPEDRPQSISEWLNMLDEKDLAEARVEDEDRTRLGGWDTETPDIVPVSSPRMAFGGLDMIIETGVPKSPSDATFLSEEVYSEGEESDARATTDTRDKQEAKAELPLAAKSDAAPVAPSPSTIFRKDNDGENGCGRSEGRVSQAAKVEFLQGGNNAANEYGGTAMSNSENKKSGVLKGEPKKALLFGGVAALVVAIISVWASFNEIGAKPDPALLVDESNVSSSSQDAINAYEKDLDGLADAAGAAGIPATVVSLLNDAGGNSTNPLRRLGRFAKAAFAAADNEVGAKRTPRPVQEIWSKLELIRRDSLLVDQSSEFPVAIASAQNLVGHYGDLRRALSDTKAAANRGAAKPSEVEKPGSVVVATTVETITSAGTTAPSPAPDGNVTDAQKREFASVLAGARDVAREVIQLGRKRPSSNASEEEKASYSIRHSAAEAAKDYQRYLDSLDASMRGTTGAVEAKQSITKAYQTRAYLTDLRQRSQLSLK
ncbi:protein kinase [Altererythrobacter salegens]|uniref:Protein kinase n=1 Tax=Croceibacterium salegens TaxID=1737568 RepID=A0A6I4SZN1_9SPHN|nr:serine/threonine-protein kinase [Croceibacterium salegens]MXO60838.1 protein kinase [Croceibacterium salegens]